MRQDQGTPLASSGARKIEQGAGMPSEHVIYMVLGGIAAFVILKLVLFGLRKLALVLVVVAGMVLGSMYWSSKHDDDAQQAPLFEPFHRSGSPGKQ
jgi:hypothetical protein